METLIPLTIPKIVFIENLINIYKKMCNKAIKNMSHLWVIIYLFIF